MNSFLSRRSAIWSATALAAWLLTACGGGADAGAGASAASVAAAQNTPVRSVGTPKTMVTPAAIPGLPTVPEYKASRSAASAQAPGVLPDAVTMSALAADNLHLAVADMRATLTSGGNLAVAPPLTYAVLRSFGAAASGDSLAQISQSFDLAPSPFKASQQTSRVVSSLWADRGHAFRAGFLSATDIFAAWPLLAAWSADEAGFADGSAAGNAAFAQSLFALNGLSIGSFSTPADIRLLMAHSLAANAGWETVVPFSGIFERAANDLVRLPLVRITAGVTRHIGVDFTADVLAGPDLQLMVLRPASGTLTDFAATRLEPALAEAAQALLLGGAVPVAGEMLLPQVDMPLTLQADGPLRRSGVNLVFDEIMANLKGLDGLGGTYVQSASPPVSLHVAADGLSLQATHALAFTFSARNAYGPGYGSSFWLVSSSNSVNIVPLGTCIWPVPDLRSFFLVLLDTRHWVVSLVAIQAPPGTAVAPTCI